MKKIYLVVVLLVCLIAVSSGCYRWTSQVETDEENVGRDGVDEETLGEMVDLYEAVEKENKKRPGEMVTSEDGAYQIMIPSGWQESENKINNTMLFELQGQTEDQYMGILVLTDKAYGVFDIVAYMDVYEENMRKHFENAIMSEKLEKDVNGNRAYTLRIKGTIEGVDYINHIYVVDYENEKVIFTANTYDENEATVIAALDEVVYSFGVVEK